MQRQSNQPESLQKRERVSLFSRKDMQYSDELIRNLM